MNIYKYDKNVIWTNHARKRLGQRGLTQELVYQAFANLNTKIKSKIRAPQNFKKDRPIPDYDYRKTK